MTNANAKRRHRQIMNEIASLGFCLPGSVVTRTTRCSSANCRCQSDPNSRHGPYLSWTSKRGTKTITRNLSAEQAERYAAWIENARRLRQLTNELEALAIEAAGEAEGWT